MTEREFTQVAEAVGLIERGDFHAEASNEMQELLMRLGEIAGASGKAKGEITIKLKFEVEGRHVSVSGEFTTKEPKIARRRQMFFLTPKGGLSQEPQSDDLFHGKPRAVEADRKAI